MTELLTIVQSGVYFLKVDTQWSEYAQGGAVRLLVNDEGVKLGPNTHPLWESTMGNQLSVRGAVWLNAGDQVQLQINSGSANNELLEVGVAQLALNDPGGMRPEPEEESS
jgi:hypothetical protein